MLKVFAQLLLGRCRHLLLDEDSIQWAEKGNQTQELIYVLRRLGRMATDWGIKIYVLKLDIEKALTRSFKATWGSS